MQHVPVFSIRKPPYAANRSACGTKGRLLHLSSDAILLRVGKFLSPTSQELDAIVRSRVVRGRDHDPEIGMNVIDEKSSCRGGQYAGVVNIHTGGSESGRHRGGDELGGNAGVARDDCFGSSDFRVLVA